MDYTEHKKQLEKTIQDAIIKFNEITNLPISNIYININNRYSFSSLGNKHLINTDVETKIHIEL